MVLWWQIRRYLLVSMNNTWWLQLPEGETEEDKQINIRVNNIFQSRYEEYSVLIKKYDSECPQNHVVIAWLEWCDNNGTDIVTLNWEYELITPCKSFNMATECIDELEKK